jgi:polyhydroxyalkanoate synthase
LIVSRIDSLLLCSAKSLHSSNIFQPHVASLRTRRALGKGPPLLTAAPATRAVQGLMQAGSEFARQYIEFLSAGTAAGPDGGGVLLADTSEWAGEVVRLQQDYLRRQAALWGGMLQRKGGEAPVAAVSVEVGDRRFAAPEWGQSPYFDYLWQSYLLNAEFLKKVAEAAPLEGQAKDRLRFLTRQYVDALAPSNFAASNPEFIKAALESKGASITAGIQNLIADIGKGRISMTDESAFEVGRNLAITPGAVIYENELIQLIQYAPMSTTVAKRPLLIVPPCINKFYVMDLQPENSLVRYMVEQGQTVFLVSWRNASRDIAHLGWDDYLEKGPLAALAVVRDLTGEEKVNALGFCVGGTILASALSVAKARGGDPAASLTLLTTLLDFSDAGEIGSFIDEATVAAREAQIGRGGLLPGRELASVFSSLRANDLIWQYVVGNYLKGSKPDAFDILYWNSDNTNLPGPFLTWYVRHMYLHNSLRVPGKLEMCSVTADLTRLDMPAYLLATREDHIVPWQGAYQSRQLLGGETTFVLGASGHIAGVINPAARNRRSYWTNGTCAANSADWLAGAQETKGSWWPHWMDWLRGFCDGEVPARGQLGSRKYSPIEPAPGRYVKERA